MFKIEGYIYYIWKQIHLANSIYALIMSSQTFDAVDGKQARRTNSSSPLGELFDHGRFIANSVCPTNAHFMRTDTLSDDYFRL